MDYIIVRNDNLQEFLNEVNRKKKEGYITCGGLVMLSINDAVGVSAWMQAMEKMEFITAELKETKVAPTNGISFTGSFKYEPKGNRWENLPSDLCTYLNQPYNCVRAVTDNLEPERDYRVTIMFEEIKS